MRRRHLLVLGCVCLAGLVMAGCAVNPSGSGSSGGGIEFFPHNIGNSWTFAAVMNGAPIGTVSLSVDSTAVYSGKTYYSLTQTSPFASPEARLFDFSSSYVKSFSSATVPTGESTWLSFPLSVGSTWTDPDGKVNTVTAVENVTVTAGTYTNCYKISSVHLSSVSLQVTNRWYSLNVGPVKEESKTTGIAVPLNMIMTSELTSVVIK